VFTDRGLPERDGRILEKVLAGPLGDIAEKTLQGERLTREEGIRLAESPDLMAIGLMADYARRCRAGDIVYFINNAHINHTNICKNLCRFCAFGRKRAQWFLHSLTVLVIFFMGIMENMGSREPSP
jgi:aminodeoxyfutalosine synthase